MTEPLEQTLFQMRYASGASYGLEAFADTVVLDTSTAPPTICALRLGGEPEQVQAMSVIIQGGGTVMADLGSGLQKYSCLERCYRRQLIRDGPYAQALLAATEEKLKMPEQKGCGQMEQEKENPGKDKFGIEQRDQLAGLPAYQVEESDDVAPPRKLYFYTHAGDTDALFSGIDAKTAVPLIPEFRDHVLTELEERGVLRRLEAHTKGTDIDAWVLQCDKDDANLIQVVEDGLRGGELTIPGADYAEEAVADVNTVTDYLNAFGVSIAERIREQFVPLYDPASEPLCPELLEVSSYIKAHAGYHLYDAQMAVAEAVVRRHRRSKCAIVVEECGIGKTKIGISALYAALAQGLKRGGARKTLNVVICPAHIKKKWVREINESLPDTFAVIVHNIAEVDSAVRRYELGEQSCYLILGKEAARDGYMRAPAVIGKRPIIKKKLELEDGLVEYQYKRAPYYRFYCPDCGEMIRIPQKRDEGEWPAADQFFFWKETQKNHKCPCCGSPFWAALNPGRQTEWVKIGNYGFIHRYGARAHLLRKNEDLPPAILQKIQMVASHPEDPYPAIGARRAYPLSSYIKRTLRGKLNCLIADELQDYNNDSGQGDAMGELFGAARYFIGLTGTLINGYSSGLFHLLYRVSAPRMVEDGKPYDSPGQFNFEYGVIQYITRTEEVEYAANRRSNVTSTITKQVPGVSPLVFTRFLLESTAFLTLKDLGKALPEYEEIPVPMTLEHHIETEYRRLEKALRFILKKDRRIARRVQSAFFNLLLAYPDQSYGQRTIFHPIEKTPLAEPAQLGSIDDLRPKDAFILKKAAEKVAAGERMVIYTSWVRLDTQKKLADLLRDQGISVQVLTASVSTEKREDWLAKKVAEGVQVLITNPTLVSTGLDLLAFTTYIYYDLGNKLFDLRQSSRRGLRLNQMAPRIEVYLLYYQETQQQNLIKLMASKLTTANMIEGGYSEEGLSAMSETEDTTTILARELMMGIRSSVEDIGAAFKKMALLHPEDEDGPGREPEEFTDNVEATKTSDADVKGLPMPAVLPVEPPAHPEVYTSAGRVFTQAEVAAVLLANKEKQQRRQRKAVGVAGQLSMFDAAS